MSVTFNLGGPKNQLVPVIVMFQGRWRLPALGGAVPRIRLVIDGVEQSGPGALTSPAPVTPNTLQGDNRDQTNGFNFISDPQEPGMHTATIQWATETAGGIDEICIEARSLVVLHR